MDFMKQSKSKLLKSLYFIQFLISNYVYIIFDSKKTIEIKEIHSQSLRLLIDYMYTGEIIINEQNFENLLSTANLLQVFSVKEACSQFIQSHLDLENCIGIREFAETHNCPVLQRHAEAFIEQYYR